MPVNQQNKTKLWVFGVAFLFVALNAVLIAYEFFWLSIIPVVALLVWMYLFALDKVIYLITFLTPLAVNISDYDARLAVSLPTEPLMAGALLLFFYKAMIESPVDNKVIKHPVSIAIFINLTWVLFTSVTSELPMVSFKYLLAQLWFIVPFYFIGLMLFRHPQKIKLFGWLYYISLILVIIYTTVNHAMHGFDGDIAHWIMSPFYNDHTSYGAMIAFFVPFGLLLIISKQEYTRSTRLLAGVMFAILLTGLILSFSRAAWLSVFAAVFVLAILLLKIKFKYIIYTILGLVIVFFSLKTEILQRLEKNKQDSSATFAEHIQSMSNITTDASNLERINRWSSALRLFEKRPVVGWGPGTYQFVYGPYQYSYEKTVISTNAGDKGNAHSEYLGPLSEMGIIGLLSVLFLFGTIIYTGVKVYQYAQNRWTKYLAAAVLLSFVTYMTHGFLNNFLTRDKAAVPFWGMAAILVALDIYHKHKTTIKLKDKEVD
ncbi:MAG: O-antigen ligase family protein [Bacteroidales bacterium]|nr:O-antigen ligase family protein [Bacteroidales bacterium]MCF8326963.1 O-antigen ligase family protein [Bacteroidales bacterium]